MKYRLATILARESHSSDTTKVIDLNLADSVSRFQIIHEAVNGADADAAGHPVQCISKIELVDGSDVLFSLSGAEAAALDFYHTKQEPPNLLLYLNNNNSETTFNMNFGRFLYDPLYAFDPGKFTNPQLKITIDVDGGGMSTDGGYLTVLADIFDEKAVTPTGFLMHKEIKDYAFGSATHEYTDLPTDYPYRKLLVKSLVAGTGPDYIFDTLKLSEDNDRRIPFNHTISEILKNMVGKTRPYRERIIGCGDTNLRYFYCTPAYWPAFAAGQWQATLADSQIALYPGDGGYFSCDCGAAGVNWQALVEGWCPHGVIEIPFGLQDDPADWYDVTKLGSLRLDILSASGMSSSQDCQIFLQQLRSY